LCASTWPNLHHSCSSRVSQDGHALGVVKFKLRGMSMAFIHVYMCIYARVLYFSAAALSPSSSSSSSSTHAAAHMCQLPSIHTHTQTRLAASELPPHVFCVRYHSRNILSPRLGATSTARAPFLLTRSMHQVSLAHAMCFRCVWY
jgi:hypothetical protein